MAVKHKGTLVQWDDAKGFGFIEPRLPGPRIFVHISDFTHKTPRPEAGLQLACSWFISWRSQLTVNRGLSPCCKASWMASR